MTQQWRTAPTSGQVGPKLQGLGKALPDKQFSRFGRKAKSENVQVSIHLPCLPFIGVPEMSPLTTLLNISIARSIMWVKL